jgi:predicted MFS family arabinose efflux permease
MTSVDFKAAVVRGIRTFVAAFLAVYGAPALIGALSGSQPLDTSALRAAAVAGVAALISLLWRTFLDPSPIPSLKDADQPATPA